MLLTQASKNKPNVKIQSHTSITSKLLTTYKKDFEPVGRTMIVWLSPNNHEALKAIDNLTSKGYDIIFNINPDEALSDCKHII